MTGRIFDIQRFSLHDGPGIRTTVFLKGCPLRCRWCHNPESISPKSQLAIAPEKCVGCGACVSRCSEGALALNKSRRAVINRSACTSCGVCAGDCETKSLEMVGRDATVDEVMAVVLRDRQYYVESGGGMTVSGREPVFQPQFTKALLGAAKTAGLHTVIETSGFGEWLNLCSLSSICSCTTTRRRTATFTRHSPGSRIRRSSRTYAACTRQEHGSSCGVR